jgi:NADP-dependent 3-hydroxy acid dehydrogenase YdfG
MELHLRGKRVLITGASKGIGAAAAEVFAEEGCHLLLAARSSDQLKALAERLRSAHQIDATACVVDLRKSEDVARLAREAGSVDILVNNAGDIPGGSIDRIDEAAWRHAWDLKVFGYINLTRAIYAQMKARGGGVIVNDIGAAGEKFDANYICGSAGNAALMAFTRSAPTATSRCSRRARKTSSATRAATQSSRRACRSAVPRMRARSATSWRSWPRAARATPRA